MLSYRINSVVAVQLNGYNLSNKYYFANSYFRSPVENHVVPGAGRTALVTVEFVISGAAAVGLGVGGSFAKASD